MKERQQKRGTFFLLLLVCVRSYCSSRPLGSRRQGQDWESELERGVGHLKHCQAPHTQTHTGLCDQSDLYFVIFKTWIKQMCRCTCSVWFSLLCALTAERSFCVYCVFRGHVQRRCVRLSVFMPFFYFFFLKTDLRLWREKRRLCLCAVPTGEIFQREIRALQTA